MRLLYLTCLMVGPLFILAQNKEITLESIWKTYDFYPKSVPGFKSMKNGEYYSKIDKKDNVTAINKYSFKSGNKIKTIVNSNQLNIDLSNYEFSADEKKILFASQTESIYRYSSKSIYYCYDLETKSIDTISHNKIRYPTFSPDGKKVAYVLNNNIFIKELESKKLIQVTHDGQKNKIINGASDWVYEEEFTLVKAFFWSPDGQHIAFYKFDESEVQEFSMDQFNNKLYPTQNRFKYPKAGEKNSEISIHVYQLESQKTNSITFEKHYEYFPRMNWTKNKDILYVQALNRHQNELDFLLVNVLDNSSKILFTEQDKNYLDIHDNTTFTDDKLNLIWTSEKDGFNHLYLVSLANGKMQQITKGNWEISKYHGMSQDGQTIFYTSNQENVINQDLYCIKIDGTSKRKLSSKIGTHSSQFSKGMKYYTNTFSTADTPPFISLHSSDGKLIRVLEDNNELIKKMENYNLSKKEFFSINTSDNVMLNAWMIKPKFFDTTLQYPVLMFLYGGPGSQQVVNSWGWFNYFWYQHLAQKGYIVVCVDNRGTGGRGSNFKKMTYLQLGKYETIDQINANKYLANLSYVDKTRIGIQGWSYGGYLSSLAITKGAEHFKLAIAVAPVTNWRYYDNIYTERYMRTPQENPLGYDENSPINHVEKLKGKYLLIHGTADDNVHVQNTYEMISALIKANKQFEMFIYPDKNHGIYGGNTRLHLYKKMTNFIEDNL